MTAPAPRLVASDLDGTLVRSDGTVSPRTVAAIAAVEAAGAPFVMVTGRPSRWMHPLVEATGHRGLAVCANGAVLYDLHTERVVEAHLLSTEVAVEVVEALRREVPGIAFAVEHPERGFGHEATYVPRWEQPEPPQPVEDLVHGGVIKLLGRHEEYGSDELLAAARAALGDLAECTHSSDDGLLEISAVGVSKASGLAAFAASHGIDAGDVIAFGDMPNDIPMLLWAGRGVAMGNGHPEVLEVADEVTGPVDDDGVADVLERWFS